MNLKISRIKHVIITAIIFLFIIAIIIIVYRGKLAEVSNNTEQLVYRVVAKEDLLPGTIITRENVELVSVQDIVKNKNLIYRLTKDSQERKTVKDTEEYRRRVEAKEELPSAPSDDFWAVGKVVVEKIYEGEFLIFNKLKLQNEVFSDSERIYSVPFEASSTGAYNVKVGSVVDVCVLYENEKTVSEYQNLPNNKVIDIVLAKKEIIDIRDESGNSQTTSASVVPGYVCFKLSYDEINKLELAKKQGQLFVGITKTYIGDAQSETFMSGTIFPNF